MLSDDPDPPSVKTETNTDSDPLATLASAAISSAVTNGVPSLNTPKPVVVKQPLKNKNQWYDVSVLKTNQCTVQNFLMAPEGLDRRDPDADFDSNTVPNFNSYIKAELEPGTAYKLRVCAVNACGRGAWSEISAFKTCLPGYPGAPSAIKITKSTEGAHLSWEAPHLTSGEITEYSVYLAVKSAQTGAGQQTVTSNPNQLAFVRVYCGRQASCTVGNTHLATAHIDTTTKPAIIFRIAARNEKGYGPATQVRWLQDTANAAPAAKPGP
ncbi:unnamed protein product, partial [Oppiella nova]